RRLTGEKRAEQSISRPRGVERTLRSRAEQCGRPIQPGHLHEDRARLVGTASAHGREGSFDTAAADVSRDPNCGFQAHGPAAVRKLYVSARPVRAANSRARRSEYWRVTGRLRSSSNFSIARWVSA